MNHPWDILADFIGRTIAQQWAASKNISSTAPSGAEPAPNSTDQNQGTTPGKAEQSPEKTGATSKQAGVEL